MASEHMDLYAWAWDILKTIVTSIVATVSFVYGWINKRFTDLEKKLQNVESRMSVLESSLITTNLEVTKLAERDKAQDAKLEDIKESIGELWKETKGQTKILMEILTKK
jgi:hypothetical protein